MLVNRFASRIVFRKKKNGVLLRIAASHAEFGMDQIALGSQVSEEGRVPVETLVCAGGALLLGAGVVEWRNAGIQRDILFTARGERGAAFTEQDGVFLQNLRPPLPARHIKLLPQRSASLEGISLIGYLKIPVEQYGLTLICISSSVE